MKKTLVFSLLLAVSGFAFEKGEISRFHRIIKGFNYPHYRESDRDILLNYQYSANRTNDIPEELDIDELETRSFHRNMNGELELNLDFISSSPVKRTDQNIVMRAGGSLNEGSTIWSNDILGMFDTTADRMSNAEGYCAYNLFFEKHFGFNRLKGLPFWGADAHVTLLGSDQRNSYYSHHNKWDSPVLRLQNIDQSVALDGTVEPSIGVSNRKPVKPVYEAFLVESKLKKAGALKGNLSDSTMYRIAELIASLKAYRLKHEKYEKFLMSGLQKILVKDSCVIDSALDAFTLFKAREGIISELPLFYSGFSARVYEVIDANGVWNSFYSTRDSIDEQAFVFDMEYFSMFELIWTFPVLKRFFLSVKLKRPFYSVPAPFNYSYFPCFGIDLYFLLLDRLLVEGSFLSGKYNVNTFFIDGELAANLYIEDKLSVRFSVRENYLNRKQDSGSNTRSIQESALIRLNYDF